MKYAQVYVLFLLFVFFTSCGGQNKTELPKENSKPETKDPVTYAWSDNDTVIQIKKGSNGTILIASYSGVCRYDGKSFTNLTRKLGSNRFSDALEDPFNILQPGRDLLIMGLNVFMKIKPALFDSAPEVVE